MGESMKKQAIQESGIAVPVYIIQSKIFFIRRQKVMLDRDLAELYGVPTYRLNEQVKRNIKRFPKDFMFQLNIQEKSELIANCDRFASLKHSTSNPYAFTEQGVAMLSSALNSDRAVEVNIQIMRVFVRIKELMISHKDLARKIEDLEGKYQDHDKKIMSIFEAIRRLIVIPVTDNYKRTKIGFIVEETVSPNTFSSP